MGSRFASIRQAAFGLLLLAGCDFGTDSPSHSPGLSVVMAACSPALGKTSAKSAQVRYVSKDSIGLDFEATLLCRADYVFQTTLAGTALRMSAKDVGDTRSRCVCARKLALDLKATQGEDYSSVRTLFFESDTFDLVLP